MLPEEMMSGKPLGTELSAAVPSSEAGATSQPSAFVQAINSLMSGTLDLAGVGATGSSSAIGGSTVTSDTDITKVNIEAFCRLLGMAPPTSVAPATTAATAGPSSTEDSGTGTTVSCDQRAVGSSRPLPLMTSTPKQSSLLQQQPNHYINPQMLALMTGNTPPTAAPPPPPPVTPSPAFDPYSLSSGSFGWEGQQESPRSLYERSSLSTQNTTGLSPAALTNLFTQLSLSSIPAAPSAGAYAQSPLLNTSTGLEDSRLFSNNYATRYGAYNGLFAVNENRGPGCIEKAARLYRNAAAVCDAVCTWSGQLPPRNHRNPIYSCKVFVGGVPWDITEQTLLQAFKPFGNVAVEWPGREARYAKAGVRPSARGKGYVYVIFDSDKSVKNLLASCSRDNSTSADWYFKLTTRRLRTREIRQVQVIPWVISDSTYVRCNNQRMDPNKSVFVGALHGMITAEVLATVMNDLFDGVVYAGIDTDKYKYPIGSGRVTFNNIASYNKAVAAAFVEIKTHKFSKKVQVDPYLEDAQCNRCKASAGPYFCRELLCFDYFCENCWHIQHSADAMKYHKPLMRNTLVSNQQAAARREQQQMQRTFNNVASNIAAMTAGGGANATFPFLGSPTVNF